MKPRGRKTVLLALPTGVLFLFLLIVTLQLFWVHRIWWDQSSIEELPIEQILQKESLEEADYQVLFSQTGLGKSAIDGLKTEENDGISAILTYQDAFLARHYVQCTPLLGWFTREDILVDENRQAVKGPPLVPLQAGDILLSLSTHSLGWRHGHAALVLDEKNTLETLSLGQNSVISSVDSWCQYSNYAVLRVQNASPELRLRVAAYAKEELNDIPYRLMSGMLRNKVMNMESRFFGAQCAYLVWYAWETFGIDLDGDGGRLVTPMDLMLSDKLEIVQVYAFPACKGTGNVYESGGK